MDATKAVINQYIVGKLEKDDIAHATLSNNNLVIIIKGISQHELQGSLATIDLIASGTILDKMEHTYRKIARAVLGTTNGLWSCTKREEIESMKNFMDGLGTMYPIFTILDDTVKIGYNHSIILEIANPMFFKNLDRAIIHVLCNDDLKLFDVSDGSAHY